MKLNQSYFNKLVVLAFCVLPLIACSGSGSNPEGSGSGNTTTGAFELDSVARPALVEGLQSGVNIPVTLVRAEGHTNDVSFTVEGATAAEEAFVSAEVIPATLGANETNATINIRLDIADRPLKEHERTFIIRADDGSNNATMEIELAVQPVAAPDVYLLIGQSNMVGFSGDGTKQDYSGGQDEPHERIFQLNVTQNDQFEIFKDKDDYTSVTKNVIGADLVRAEDPLHFPINPFSNDKEHSYIGLGLSFAKAALTDTTQDIVLVPAAWSGSSFCSNDFGPNAQWNAQETNNPELGNTWLFDRALTRTKVALDQSGGILRGILWHQGESDSNEECASLYLENLERLAQQLRLRAAPDLRGGDYRQPDSNIPFILGTMSRGIDERGDLSTFPEDKEDVDNAHKLLPTKVAHVEVVNNDDLIPENGYPCGNSSCIHFGPNALREMGRRYYEALLQASYNR